MFLNLYFQPRESLYQMAREPLMKAQEGKRTDGRNHNRQLVLYLSWAPSGRCQNNPGLPKKKITSSSCGRVYQLEIISQSPFQWGLWNTPVNHLAGHKSSLSLCNHSVFPRVMGKRSANNQIMFVLRRFKVTMSWVITV